MFFEFRYSRRLRSFHPPFARRCPLPPPRTKTFTTQSSPPPKRLTRKNSPISFVAIYSTKSCSDTEGGRVDGGDAISSFIFLCCCCSWRGGGSGRRSALREDGDRRRRASYATPTVSVAAPVAVPSAPLMIYTVPPRNHTLVIYYIYLFTMTGRRADPLPHSRQIGRASCVR